MDFKSTLINGAELVFLDVETTGLNSHHGDAICEIGAVKICDGRKVDSFQSLINPQRPMPAQASAIHHICDEQLKDAPCFRAVADKFLYFMGKAVLCGYNVNFDLEFLNTELRRIQYAVINPPTIDVLIMARRTLQLKRYTLEFLSQHFWLPPAQFHRAGEDAAATRYVFLKITELLAAKGIKRLYDFIVLYGGDTDVLNNYRQNHLITINESILSQCRVQINYVSYAQLLQTFAIVPQKLWEDKGQKYLLGIDPKTQRPLTFNFSRILDVGVG